jgi:hypothetical protein
LSAKCNTKILALNWFDAKTHLPKILSMPSFWFDDFGTQPIKSLMTDKKAPLKPREKVLYLSEGHKQHYRQTHHDSTWPGTSISAITSVPVNKKYRIVKTTNLFRALHDIRKQSMMQFPKLKVFWRNGSETNLVRHNHIVALEWNIIWKQLNLLLRQAYTSLETV